jgi:UDP-glucose 4-epimerase/UDP-arabinose 4-epimerase
MDSEDDARILITGGAGFIGAHTAKAVAECGLVPVVFDNLSSGHRDAVLWGDFVHGDIRDGKALADTLERYKPSAVIHFASLIEVGRSVARPDLFYDHNVTGTATLLAAMRRAKTPRLVFSSSAAVYGQQASTDAIVESAPKDPASPYGDTKLACERMIAAQCRAFGLTGVALRYFNAAGSDPEGRIGESHQPETHLIPLAIDAALGLGPPLTLFGVDFDTPDGSCLRDFIHVDDLAQAHVRALSLELAPGRFEAFNIGTGRGHSVLQVLRAVEKATGRPAPHQIGARREGDPASLIAAPAKARAQLGWEAQRSSLDEIVGDALRWRSAGRYGLRRPQKVRAAE